MTVAKSETLEALRRRHVLNLILDRQWDEIGRDFGHGMTDSNETEVVLDMCILHYASRPLPP
jgi:hypothetical protein